jgi:alpha-1,2-mannosyltransferase
MAFVYPAVSAVLFAPRGLIGRGAASTVYVFLCILCIPATLRILDVRDWRVYCVTLLWFPLFNGWQSGNVTLPLMLMVAIAWRFRDRPWIAGFITALAISIKPFVWPLGLWLLATRRWKAAGMALASGFALNLVGWAILGFNEISTYLHLASVDARSLWKEGYSVLAVAHHLGSSRSFAEIVLVLVAAGAAAALIHVGAARRSEHAAMALAVGLMLFASPLVWAHYFSLLLVPLALRRPTLSAAWALPILMWPVPPRQPVYGWEEALVWGVAAAIIAVGLRGGLPEMRQPVAGGAT